MVGQKLIKRREIKGKIGDLPKCSRCGLVFGSYAVRSNYDEKICNICDKDLNNIIFDEIGDIMDNLRLEKTFEQDETLMYDIKFGNKRIGEIALSKYGDAIHMEFVEIDPKYRGHGLYQKTLELIMKRNPECKNISGEVTNKRALSAIQKSFGIPDKFEGNLDILPDEAEYAEDGTIISDLSVLVRWKRPNILKEDDNSERDSLQD